jgi:hypothetical protein
MKKIIFLAFFALFFLNVSAQTRKHVIVLKTNPAAYLAKDLNLGLEFGLTPRLRLTFSAFLQSHDHLDFIGKYMNSEYSQVPYIGYVLRSGVKCFLTAKKKNWTPYLEPQYRFGKLDGVVKTSQEIGNTISYNSKIQKHQLLLLLGSQRKIANAPIIVDVYIGVGALKYRRQSTILESKLPSDIGKIDVYKDLAANCYFGTSFGISF